MKKVIYILIAILTFSISFWAFRLRALIIPISLNEAVENTELYRWQNIHIKTYLEVRKFDLGDPEIDSTAFDFKENCLASCINRASVQLPENIENDQELSNFVYQLIEQNEKGNSEDGVYFAEVEITGEIREINTCFTFPNSIKAEKIKQLSPIQFMSNSEYRQKKRME